MRVSKLIKFQKKGLLNKIDFETFLGAARKIADFDREERVWIVNWRKVFRIDYDDLEKTLSTLREYSTIDEEAINLILKEFFQKKKFKRGQVFIDSNLRIHASSDVLDTLQKDDHLRSFILYKFNFE